MYYLFKNLNVPAAISSTFTITIANPGVVSWTNHGLAAGTALLLTTTGALPTGLTAGNIYYVSSDSIAASTFRLAPTVADALAGTNSIVTTGTQSGTHTATGAPNLKNLSYFSEIMFWPGGNMQIFIDGGTGKTLDSGHIFLQWSSSRTGNFQRWGSIDLSGSLPQRSSVVEVPAGYVLLEFNGSSGSSNFSAGIGQSRAIS